MASKIPFGQDIARQAVPLPGLEGPKAQEAQGKPRVAAF